MSIQSESHGLLARTVGGELCMFPACAESNPCDPDPGIIVSVSGVGPATISWAGNSWTLPDDSGKEYTICPDEYNLSQGKYAISSVYYGYTYFLYSRYYGRHTWLGSGVDLRQRYTCDYWYWGDYHLPLNLGVDRNVEYIRLFDDTYFADYRAFSRAFTSAARPITPTYSYIYDSDVGIITTGKPFPTYSDYTLSSDWFFGSYTNGSGVTYSWSKGDGWPAE